MAEFVDRLEDMSPKGWLRLCIEDDGDVIIECGQWDESRNLIDPTASVQFCTMSGGGRSPRTHKALRDLAVAMAQDNADSMKAGGQNEWSGSEILKWQ